MPNDRHATQILTAASDTPGVLLPPPLIPLAMLIAGIILQDSEPLGWLHAISSVGRTLVGSALSVAGIFGMVSARQAFVRHETNVNPYRPSLAIVTDGIYARTRNPIYVAGIAFTIGIALVFALDWLILLHLIGLPVLHHGVVLREERYLEHKFGNAYVAYKATVRRYL